MAQRRAENLHLGIVLRNYQHLATGAGLAREIASSWDEAHALAGLGRCALADGHRAQAGVLLRQALEIFQRIGAAEVPELLAELDALAGPPPAR